MMMKALFMAGLLAAAPSVPPLPTVPKVDLARYLGTWYEIARYPNRFQKDCDSAVAAYALLPDGRIEVRNTCRQADGAEKSVLGVAKISDTASNAKLKVSFVPAWLRWTGIGWGDYWIVDLAPDYSYAVVSEPGRRYLWILNRKPSMPKATYAAIGERMKALDLDPARLISAGPGRLESAR